MILGMMQRSAKNGFSDLTKEEISQDQHRKHIMNDHQKKAIEKGCHEREEAQMGVSSID